MSVNVNRNVLDTFYRYKMPKILAKVEGKGNGIKTVIVNMVDVAKALSRPPTYPTKFFGCELGAQTQFDFKNDRYIVNGSHEASKLQSLLDIFIKKYVLCPECDNPETILWPNDKKGIIKQTCKACGYQGLIDMRHKLTTFILKNPPGMKPDQQGTSLTRKKDRKKEQEKDKLRPGSPLLEHSDNSDSMSLNGEAEDDGEWTVSISEDAIKERMSDLTAGVKGLTMDDDAEKPLGERLEIFFAFCNKLKESGSLNASCDKAVLKEIVAEAKRLEIMEGKAVMVLIEVVFDENICKQIPAYKPLFILFSAPKSQKYLLGAIEKLIEVKDLFVKSINICKLLYDHDYVDEEIFKEWHQKQSKKYVSKEACAQIHTKVAPFIQWLHEAEEESDEDDDDEIDIVYDDKAAAKTLKDQCDKKDDVPAVAVAQVANGGPESQDDDSDVDIDNL